MTRSERLEPISALAESRERDAAKAMAAAQQALAQQEARLAELRGYRDDYGRRLQDGGRKRLDAAQLADFRLFLARLNEAIGYQEQRVAEARVRCEQARQAWLAQHQKSAALDKAITRLRGEERRTEERAEQKASDERAQQGHGRRTPPEP